jgi:uncharacterized phage protein gp47/JayE
MLEIIHDVISGDISERKLTTKEIADSQAAKAIAQAEQAERDAEQAAKDTARQVVLDKLGLSADEVAALLG